MLKIITSLLLIYSNAYGQTPAITIPDFEFYRLNNTSFTNKELVPGKIVFLLFFDSDCDHCHRAIQRIRTNYKSFQKVSVYFISLDDPKKMIKTIDTYGPGLRGKKNITLLQDKHNQFIEKFKPRKYPSMFLYSPNKNLLDYEDNEETVFRIIKSIKSE